MKKFFLTIFILLCLVSAANLQGCGQGCGGTETGNPACGEGIDETGPFSDETQTAAERILDSLCNKLTECFDSLTQSECQTGVLGTDQIDNELGLTEGSFSSYLEIINAERGETISADSDALNTCLSDIRILDCSDEGVQAAYSEADPDNFDNVENMVPAGIDSCEGVY